MNIFKRIYRWYRVKFFCNQHIHRMHFCERVEKDICLDCSLTKKHSHEIKDSKIVLLKVSAIGSTRAVSACLLEGMCQKCGKVSQIWDTDPKNCKKITFNSS